LTVARQPFEKLTLELRAMGYRKLSARPAITPKLRALLRAVHACLDEREKGSQCRDNRNFVPGRDAHRLEEQDHSTEPMQSTQHTALDWNDEFDCRPRFVASRTYASTA
jgi:hypothetical protein